MNVYNIIINLKNPEIKKKKKKEKNIEIQYFQLKQNLHMKKVNENQIQYHIQNKNIYLDQHF